MLTNEQFENLKKQAQDFIEDCEKLNQIMEHGENGKMANISQ